jgi:hypothetical protein
MYQARQDHNAPHGVVVDRPKYGAIVDRWFQGKSIQLGEKPAPMSLHPPRISLYIKLNFISNVTEVDVQTSTEVRRM